MKERVESWQVQKCCIADINLYWLFALRCFCLVTSVSRGFPVAAWLLQCHSRYVWPWYCCVAAINSFIFGSGTIMLYCCYNVVMPTLSCWLFALRCFCLVTSCGFAIAAWLLQCSSRYVWPCYCYVAIINQFMFISGTIVLYCCYSVLPTLSCYNVVLLTLSGYNVVLPTLSCIDYSLFAAFATSLLCLLTSVPRGCAIAAWLLQCRSCHVWPCNLLLLYKPIYVCFWHHRAVLLL